MVKISDMIKGPSIKARRVALGVSQAALAERVRALSEQKFSQQALAKFEKNSATNSAFTIYILDALASFEKEQGMDKVAQIFPIDDRRGTPPDGDREEVIKLIEALKNSDIVPLLEDLSRAVSTEAAARIAALFSARVQRDLEAK